MNKRHLLIFVLVITIISLIIYFKRRIPLECTKKISFDELKDYLETGDLLLFSGNTTGEKAIKTYTLSDFSHISLIIRSEKGNQIWLWESDIGQHHKDGPRAITLENKLKKWKGDNIVRVCKTGLKIDPTKLNTLIQNILPQSMDYDMLSWMFGKSYKPPQTWFCSELVVYTLNNTTKWKSIGEAFRYSPKRIVCEMIDDLGAIYQDFEPSLGKW